MYAAPVATNDALVRRTTNVFLSWPLSVQITVFILPLMLWVPGYFLAELIRESSWQHRSIESKLQAPGGTSSLRPR
jgi:hypothetical protein